MISVMDNGHTPFHDVEDELEIERLLLACVLLESLKFFLADHYYEPLLWFMIIDIQLHW